MNVSPERTFALVVGIERYAAGDRWTLRGPANDACRFADWLVRGRKVPPRNVFLCLSPSDQAASLPIPAGCPVTAATREAVQDVLMKRLPRKGDLLFVFWGGHGVVDHERERRLFYQDATDSFKQNLDLREFLLALRTNRFFDMRLQVCIVDTCANRFDDRRTLAGLPRETFGDTPDTVLNNQFSLFGASPGEVALNDPQARTGLFSRVVLEELDRLPAHAWPPPMEQVAAQTLARFDELRARGEARQTPAYSWVSDWSNGVATRGNVVVSGASEPRLGPVVSHLCDRGPHVSRFGAFLREHLNRTERRPLVVILYGESGHGHDSFVERVVGTDIHQRIQELWGTDHPAAPQRKAPWESLSPLVHQAKRQIADEIVSRVGPGSSPRTLNYHDLNLHTFEPSRLLILRHRFQVDDWTPDRETLLRWYLEEYWPARFPDATYPNVLVFLQLVCEPARRLSWRRLWSGRIRVADEAHDALQRLAKAPQRGAVRVLIEELTAVKPEHVKNWCIMNELFPFPYEARCEKLAGRVFTNKDGTVSSELPMAEVERRLDTVLKRMVRRQPT
jgi:hypothetical protein